ncbi:hypothetical protein LZ30DRAFT_81867 [Colletotrichum cereale]|nr:hypothetical protein LZ30DRAFT_81867 [Colletotrichum cereale]
MESHGLALEASAILQVSRRMFAIFISPGFRESRRIPPPTVLVAPRVLPPFSTFTYRMITRDFCGTLGSKFSIQPYPQSPVHPAIPNACSPVPLVFPVSSATATLNGERKWGPKPRIAPVSSPAHSSRSNTLQLAPVKRGQLAGYRVNHVRRLGDTGRKGSSSAGQ